MTELTKFMSRKLWVLALALLAGCNSDPSTNVRQPMTVRPNPTPQVAQADGAIYHVENGRPLFEDRRARFVGDTLTINIVEKTSATKSSTENGDRKNSADIAVGTPTILGYTPKAPLFGGNIPGMAANGVNMNTSFNSASEIKTNNSASDANSNAFSGSITVTVLETLPNGNLVVSGEKQIAVNDKSEFVRLSGVVNPINITSSNTVNSTQLADARIESKSKQDVDTAQIVSMLARFFVALLPL